MTTELIIAVFQDNEQAADDFLQKFHDAPKDAPFTIESAVAVRKDQKGRHPRQTLG